MVPRVMTSDVPLEMKSAVKTNHRKSKEAEPEIAAHPRLCAPAAPRWHAFTRAEKRCKNHEAETDDSEREADGASAARPSWRFGCMEDVHDRRNREDCQRCEGPAALRFVHPHIAGPWPSISAKNVRGSTRCA